MSYNITRFKLKELEDFSLPVAALYRSESTDWHPERTELAGGKTLFKNMETELTGKVINERLFVTGIYCSGEGSGRVMTEMLEPAFLESIGHLVASCVWEGGDSISQLEVLDGNLSWEPIEI